MTLRTGSSQARMDGERGTGGTRGKEREGLGGSRLVGVVVVSVPQRVTWRWSQSGGR